MNITDHILVIGLGSIGQRHFRNLQELGVPCISAVSSKSDLPQGLNINKRFLSLEEALDSDEFFSAAFVCTPTAMHSVNMRLLLKRGVDRIYLEKPIGHKVDEARAVGKIIAEHGARVVVGYDLHFDPGIEKLRSLLNEKIIGHIVGVNAVVGQYLPDWRPQEDYRKGMSASKEKGGGVMLDLVHEIDYLRWLFGNISDLACFYANTGSLEIETEDLSHIICRYGDGVLGSISLDYLQRKLVRYCRITGSRGTIKWDLAGRSVSWITADSEQHYSYDHFERNDRFKAIVQSFLSEKNDDRLTSYPEALHSLEVVEAARRSSELRQVIKLN